MKRTSALFFALLFVVNLLTIPVAAADIDADVDNTIYYEDGSYAVITQGSAARSSTDREKTYTYYNPQGQRCFAYVLCAVFTYNGVTSSADSCHYRAGIYRQGWDMKSHSEYVSGSTAYGRAVFTGPNGETRNVSLTLACDKNGNVT